MTKSRDGDEQIVATRDELALIVCKIAQDGLPKPRDLDSALDAILQTVHSPEALRGVFANDPKLWAKTAPWTPFVENPNDPKQREQQALIFLEAKPKKSMSALTRIGAPSDWPFRPPSFVAPVPLPPDLPAEKPQPHNPNPECA